MTRVGSTTRRIILGVMKRDQEERGSGDSYRSGEYISRIESTIEKWPLPRIVVLMRQKFLEIMGLKVKWTRSNNRTV